MAAAVIGSLRVILGMDSAAFEAGMDKAQKQLRGVGRQFQAVGAQMSSIGAGMSVAITAPLIAAGFAASKAATEAADAMGQVEAALTSMGDASGRTKDQLADMASDIMRNSLYDDDDILRKVTANLLTFGNVAKEQFDRAQVVAADLATRMQMDLQPATLLVGKALNDPIKGMTALGRAGIQFTAAQKEAIKAMVATGNAAGAQGLILTELERQFGGAAAAAQNTDPYDKIRDSMNDLSESFGTILNTHLKPLLDTVASLADRFNGLSPQMQGLAVAGAAIAAALGPVLIVVGSVVSAIGSLSVALASGGVLAGLAGFAAAAIPFVAAGAAIGAALYLFRDDLAPIFEEFRAAAEAALGPALQQIMAAAKDAFAALGPAISAVVAVVGPILAALAKLFLQAFGPIILRALQVLAAGIGNAFSVVAATLRVITALLKGDWAGAWNAAGSLVMTIVRGVGNIVEAVFPGIGRVVGRMVDEVRNFLGGRLAEIFNGAIRKVREVGDAFHDLYIRVVGNSDIPDLVTEVGEWMGKLQQALVDPATKATKDAGDRFEQLRQRVQGIMQGLLTDRERLRLDFATDMADLNNPDTVKAFGQDMVDRMRARRRADYDRDSAGLDAENLTNPTRDAPSFDFLEPFNRTMDAMNRSIEQSRERFADAFADGLDAAMRGDWQGVLRAALGDIFGNAARSLGRSLFDGAGGAKGGGVDWGSAISGIFNKLPKFAAGATIPASGASGLDSQLMAFWKAPGERVDVYTPGKDQGPARGGGGGPMHFDMRGAVMTADLLAQAEQMAAQSGGNALRTARTAVPADRKKSDRYTLSGHR